MTSRGNCVQNDWQLCTKYDEGCCDAMGDVKCDNGWHLTRASVIKIRIAACLAQGRTPEERVEEVAALLQGKQKTGNAGKAEVRNHGNPNTESKTPAWVPGKASCNAAPDDGTDQRVVI